MDTDHADPLADGRPSGAPGTAPARRTPRLAAVGVLALTLGSWGGRIGLLAAAPTAGDVVRIGGSVAIGVATAAVLWRRRRVPRLLAAGFVAWNLAVWARAVVVAWIDPPSLGFALVHTALGLAWAWASWAVWRLRDGSTRP